MNKNDFVSSVAAKAGLMKAGDKIALVGFGTFSVAERGERQGINPATQQTITIPAKKSAKFKGGKELTEALN